MFALFVCIFFLGIGTLFSFFVILAMRKVSKQPISLIQNKSANDPNFDYFENLCGSLGTPYRHWQLADGTVVERCDGLIENRKVQLNFWKRKTPEVVTYDYWDHTSSTPSLFPQKIDVFEVLEIRIKVRQKFWFRMKRQKVSEKDVDLIHAGLDWLDREYFIHADQTEAAERFLQRVVAHAHLSNWPHACDKLEISHGELCLTFNEPRRWKMDKANLAYFMEELLLIIREYEADEVIMRAISSRNSSVCPYCRNEFDELSDSVVACQNCSTRLHESCWNENQQCTTWGCKATESVPFLIE